MKCYSCPQQATVEVFDDENKIIYHFCRVCYRRYKNRSVKPISVELKDFLESGGNVSFPNQNMKFWRDSLAKEAMKVILDGIVFNKETIFEDDIARQAYKMADAMLRERDSSLKCSSCGQERVESRGY